MPGNERRTRGRPRKTSEKDKKLSLKYIEEEIDDLTIFGGVLAYANLQQKYENTPKEEEMTLDAFEDKIEEFKSQKIYKTEIKTVEEIKQNPQEQNSTPTAGDKKEG